MKDFSLRNDIYNSIKNMKQLGTLLTKHVLVCILNTIKHGWEKLKNIQINGET